MRKRIIITFLVLCQIMLVIPALFSETWEIFEQIPYSSTLYRTAQKPEILLRLPIGNKNGEVGNPKPVADRGKHPQDFYPLPDGSFWVLDDRHFALKLFSPTGECRQSISLKKWRFFDICGVVDFVPVPGKGLFLLTNPESDVPSVIHLDSNGKSLGSWGAHGHEIGFDSERQSLYVIAGDYVGGEPGLEEYGLDGSHRLTISGEGLSGIFAAKDEVFGANVQGRDQARLFRKTVTGQETLLATFSLTVPENDTDCTPEIGIIGRDASGSVYLYAMVSSEPDSNRVFTSCLIKFAPDGNLMNRTDIFFPVIDYFYELTDFVTRFYLVRPDVVLSFDTRGKWYRILKYTFP